MYGTKCAKAHVLFDTFPTGPPLVKGRSLLIVRRLYLGKGSTNLYDPTQLLYYAVGIASYTPVSSAVREQQPLLFTVRGHATVVHREFKNVASLWGAGGGLYTSVFRWRVQTPQYDNIGSVIIRVVKYGIDFARGLSAGRKVRAAKIACICHYIPFLPGVPGTSTSLLFLVVRPCPFTHYDTYTRLPRICNLFLFKKKK